MLGGCFAARVVHAVRRITHSKSGQENVGRKIHDGKNDDVPGTSFLKYRDFEFMFCRSCENLWSENLYLSNEDAEAGSALTSDVTVL